MMAATATAGRSRGRHCQLRRAGGRDVWEGGGDGGVEGGQAARRLGRRHCRRCHVAALHLGAVPALQVGVVIFRHPLRVCSVGR
jgi:hypothetical protein